MSTRPITLRCGSLAARFFMYAQVFLILILSQHSFPADPGNPGKRDFPFRPGERLTYELRWGFIPAGTAVLEVLPTEELAGVKVHHFVMTARSNSFIDTFYPVRDRIDAYADMEAGHSLLYLKRQHEGRHKRDERISFDWTNSEVHYENFGKKRGAVSISAGTFDPLSVFYSFRLRCLQENSELHASVTDGKKCVLGMVRVLGRQEIEVAGGKVETFLVEPDLRDIGGVFRKSRDAGLRIWVTANEQRIPVRISSRVVVGDFIAELVSIHRD